MSHVLVLVLAAAHAQDPSRVLAEEQEASRWGGSATLTTAFVSGPVNAGVTGTTLTDRWEEGPTWNPALDLSIALSGRYRARPLGFLTASWAVRRGFRFSDTGDDGFQPGNGGATSSQGLDTGDLTLAYTDLAVVTSPEGRWALVASSRLTLPASRESLVCNPMFAALGLTVGGRAVVGPVTEVRVTASADRAFHQFAAAPRGRCGLPLDQPTVDTLTGAVAPTPWGDGEAWAAGANPAWTLSGGLTITGWHGVFGLVPGASSTKSWGRVLSDLSVGVRAQIARRQPEDETDTLTGSVALAPSRTPAVLQIPWSLGASGRVHDHLSIRGGVSNQAPTLLYDPSARLRALPSTLTLSLSLTGAW